MSRSWDVFCRVIDNFGDAAVCWRLSRQLTAEHGARVRLWIDALDALHMLCPQVVLDRPSQVVAGVEIHHWTPQVDFGRPADVCVEAFGGGLPDAYPEAMAQRHPASLWLILEYLSAEPWVVSHHGLPSPHPRLPLQRFFFFPGVLPGSGGVLKEAALVLNRNKFQGDPARSAVFWRDLGFRPPDEAGTVVSLFGYENAAVAELLQIWSDGPRRVVAAVPQSLLRPQVSAFFGATDPGDGASLERGFLEVRFMPFLPQTRYDELLWACDWNFVRGEDSFVRAQWAGRPLAWHIYPQQEDAHWAKLEAFMQVYCAGLDEGLAQALRGLWRFWNDPERLGPGQIQAVWRALEGRREVLRRHAMAWSGRLDLAGEL